MRPTQVLLTCFVLIVTVGCTPLGGATDAQLAQISALKRIWPASETDSLEDRGFAGGEMSRKPSGGEADKKSFSTAGMQPDQIFLDGLSKEIQTCADVAQRHRSAYDQNRAWAIGIATVGIIAGAIVVPAMAAGSASAAWVAGVGGVAGAANAAQLTLNSHGMSADQSARTYSRLIEKIDAHLASLNAVQTGLEGTIFILRLRAICLLSPLPETSGAPNVTGY